MAVHEIPLIGLAADLLCPERCVACPALVAPRRLACTSCWSAIRRLGAPECAACGHPDVTLATCGDCRARPSPIRAARAWAAYDGVSGRESPVARAIAAFKYGGAPRLGRRFADVMATRVPSPDVALVLPVPLHPRRLRRRGFNQSAVLARCLGRLLGRPVDSAALVRTRDTPSQTALRVVERARNVAGAFGVVRPPVVAGRVVLLVDDVWTSGATVRAAAAALRDAGARAVDVLTLARVV